MLNPKLYVMRFSFGVQLILAFFAFTSCARWDADKYFEHEKQAADEKLRQENQARLETAEENLAQARLSALSGIRVGMNGADLQKVAGYRYDPLARTSSSDQIWERRRYLLSHVVASRWGSFSPESKLCDQHVELFTVTLVNGIVREVDFAY